MGGRIANNDFAASWRAALAVALAHSALAYASLALVRWSTGLAAIWPPNSVLLFYMLLAPRRNWWPAMLLVAIASALTNTGSGIPSLLSSIFAIANVLESLAIATVVRVVLRRDPDLERVEDLWRFVIACIGGVILSALLAAAGISSLTGQSFGIGWQSWFLSDLLGALIVTPVLLVGRKALVERNSSSGRSFAEGVGVLLLVASVSMFVFLQHSWPLLFLIEPPVLIATFRLRGVGATLSMLIVATIGSAGTILGSGPLALVHGSVGEHLAVLQAFLATTILTALPIAAVLAERDRFSRRVQDSEERFRAVVEVVSEVIFRTDARGRWTFLNPAWERLTGYSIEDSIGQSFLRHVIAEDRAGALLQLGALEQAGGDSIRYQARFRDIEGNERWAEILTHRLTDGAGRTTGSAGTIVDISDRVTLAAHAEDARRRAEQDAAAALHLAATDELTGVASRRAFLAYFDEQLKCRGERPLSVAIFDLDHFKQVNDRYGHAAGDEVLRRVAGVAGRCVRDGDLIGRLGGEEFAILMPGATIEQAARAAERLRLACLSMSRRDDSALSITISIGVAAARADSDVAALLREADAALYRAKAEGRNCLRLAA